MFHEELRLSGEVLAEIFLGDVKAWNAPQIAKLNPGVSLPSLAIQVVNRPAGKGSNFVFTDFLSKVSSKFRAQVGVSPSPKWPVGEPAERSSDMADKVKNNPGSIGYVEYQYAVKNGISQAQCVNPSGKFVKASTESMAAACKAAEAPRWNNFSASLSNASGADSFPITSFSWIYLRTKSSDSARAATLSDFLNWIYTDGQQICSSRRLLPNCRPAAGRSEKQSQRFTIRFSLPESRADMLIRSLRSAAEELMRDMLCLRLSCRAHIS